MRNRWDWAESIWHRCFEPLSDRGFRLDRVEEDEYWRTHERELRAHFPPEVFINVAALRTSAAQRGIERMSTCRDDHPLRDFCIVRHDDRVVATFSGYQQTTSCYRQWHTHIHPDYRRQGLYRLIVDGTIAYSGELGFDTIRSEHAPSNNPVLIAKLRAGFRITALEIDPVVGLSVILSYFHNADQRAAYEYRCGLATLDNRIIAAGSGAMPLLRQQFRDADAADGATPAREP